MYFGKKLEKLCEVGKIKLKSVVFWEKSNLNR